jgi:hypothetical protein
MHITTDGEGQYYVNGYEITQQVNCDDGTVFVYDVPLDVPVQVKKRLIVEEPLMAHASFALRERERLSELGYYD